jgi:hypothetical protein
VSGQVGRVIRGVDVGDREWALAVYLNDGPAPGHREMMVCRGCRDEPAGPSVTTDFRSIASPRPTRKVPSITVTDSRRGSRAARCTAPPGSGRPEARRSPSPLGRTPDQAGSPPRSRCWDSRSRCRRWIPAWRRLPPHLGCSSGLIPNVSLAAVGCDQMRRDECRRACSLPSGVEVHSCAIAETELVCSQVTRGFQSANTPLGLSRHTHAWSPQS